MTQVVKIGFLFIFSVLSIGTKAQSNNKQIVKITYVNSPVSQYRMTESDMRRTATKASVHEFMQGITSYYSLYINLKDRSSIYILDSTTQVRPIGWENPKVSAALVDTVLFTVKSPENQTYKHEWIMHQTFYSEGQVGDIQWDLSNEEKTISGMKCKKATARDKYPMLTVWYTKELPISNGPSIYQGLPGLVVWAEDYFRTIEMKKIEYTADMAQFNKLYSSLNKNFSEEKKKGKHYNKESLLIVKKGDLAKGSYEYFHGKPYTK